MIHFCQSVVVNKPYIGRSEGRRPSLYGPPHPGKVVAINLKAQMALVEFEWGYINWFLFDEINDRNMAQLSP